MGFLDLHQTGVNKCRGMPKKYFPEDRMHHPVMEGFTDGLTRLMGREALQFWVTVN